MVGLHANHLHSLRILSWNIGTLSLRNHLVARLLLDEAPHLCLLQEARCAGHEFRALCATLRDMGYVAKLDASRNLLAIWRRGLDCAPIDAGLGSNGHYRVQRLALDLADTRVVIRNIHAPSHNQSERDNFHLVLAEQQLGDCYIDVGDFNQVPLDSEDGVAYAPSCHTFRRKATTNAWCSTIDGARVSWRLAQHGGRVAALDARDRVQHKPILFMLNTYPITHHTWMWKHAKPGASSWTPDSFASFADSIAV